MYFSFFVFVCCRIWRNKEKNKEKKKRIRLVIGRHTTETVKNRLAQQIVQTEEMKKVDIRRQWVAYLH